MRPSSLSEGTALADGRGVVWSRVSLTLKPLFFPSRGHVSRRRLLAEKEWVTPELIILPHSPREVFWIFLPSIHQAVPIDGATTVCPHGHHGRLTCNLAKLSERRKNQAWRRSEKQSCYSAWAAQAGQLEEPACGLGSENVTSRYASGSAPAPLSHHRPHLSEVMLCVDHSSFPFLSCQGFPVSRMLSVPLTLTLAI